MKKIFLVFLLGFFVSGCDGITSKAVIALKNSEMINCKGIRLNKLVNKGLKEVVWAETKDGLDTYVSFEGEVLNQIDTYVKVYFYVTDDFYQFDTMFINTEEENAFEFEMFIDDLCTYYNE